MAQGKKGLRWSNLSYAARLTLTFAFVVVITVIVAFGTLALVLNHDISADPVFAVGVTAVIALVIAIAIGFLFARTMVRPINHITSTARAIQEGDLYARTYLQGEDEVARLGETFDAMADAIEKDRLLESYGRLVCAKADLEQVDRGYLVATRKSQYSTEALIRHKSDFKRTYPRLTVEPVTLDELMVFIVKGERA